MKNSFKFVIVCTLLAVTVMLAATSCALFGGNGNGTGTTTPPDSTPGGDNMGDTLFKVTFIDFYGEVISTQYVKSGDGAVAPAIDNKIGAWLFDGWDSDFAEVKEDMTVRATYKNTGYTVKYDTQGLVEISDEVCEKSSAPTSPELTAPEGYIFGGWYLDSSYRSRYDFSYSLGSDTTLYAKIYNNINGEYTVISSASDLGAIGADPDGKYVFVNDIDLRGESLSYIPEFNGEIYGNGYKIRNFILSSTADTVGVIGKNNGYISDIILSGFKISFTNETSKSIKYFGILCGLNSATGYIENCHIQNGDITVIASYKNASDNVYGFVGAFAGDNLGIIDGCTSNADISVSFTSSYDANGHGKFEMYTCVGGICGANSGSARVSECASCGDVSLTSYVWVGKYGNITLRTRVGGVCGQNYSVIESCMSDGKVTHDISDNASVHIYTDSYVGGFVGINAGEIRNAYKTGSVKQTGKVSYSMLGGFAALNQGKIISAYSTASVEDTTGTVNSAGGFVGYNELKDGSTATVSKCFSTGNIILKSNASNTGAFVARSTGTEFSVYYLDTFTLTVGENVTSPSLERGEARSEDVLKGTDFVLNTVYFETDVWSVTDGTLPTLKCLE